MANNSATTNFIIAGGLLVAIIVVAYFLLEKNRGTLVNLETTTPRTIQLNSVNNYTINNHGSTARTLPLQATSYHASVARILHLKDKIENGDVHRLLYNGTGATRREEAVHLLFSVLWADSGFTVDREVRNGRGAVDFVVSFGNDKTVIEFKLASNTHLRRNLEKQLDIYSRANNNAPTIAVIVYTTEKEFVRVNKILGDLGKDKTQNIFLIDARQDNKQCASVA